MTLLFLLNQISFIKPFWVHASQNLVEGPRWVVTTPRQSFGMIDALMDIEYNLKGDSKFFVPLISINSAATWPLKHSKVLNH